MKAFTINNKLIKLNNKVIGKTIPPFEGIILDIQGTNNDFYSTSLIPPCKIWYLDVILWDSYDYTSFNDIRNVTGLDFSTTVELKILPYNNNNNLIIRDADYLDIKQWGSFSFSELEFRKGVGFTNHHSLSLSISASDAPIFSQNANIDYMFFDCQYFNSDISHWDVQNVSLARWTFNNARLFNQDLSTWYFPLIPYKHYSFDFNAYSWVLPKPNYGISPP